MKTLEYTIRFLTPAFLGNAEQSGQWRTPPFKALLRQWWRVAVAVSEEYNVAAMRKREGELFGVAADGGDSHKSLVRIRLDNWSDGTLNQAPAIGQVSMGKNQIPASLYSGYGPVVPGPRLKANTAVQSGAETIFRIAFPESQHIEQALALMNAYGTVGGRSRNGWGSFELKGELTELQAPVRNWKDCMQLDWAHAIGKDESALIWQSQPQQKWEDAMRLLAQVRADLRRAVPDRLILSYPDTKGTMPGWTKNERVPNSLRFKVRSQDKQFVAVIFHVPCRPADVLWLKLQQQKKNEFQTTFAKAHEFLERHREFKRATV